MNESARLARLFKILSVEARLRIIQLLRTRDLCVGALSARLHVTQGAVSQHLRILRDADLVIPEKRGYYVHYRLNPKTLAKWEEAIARFLSEQVEQRETHADWGKSKRKGETLCVRKRRPVRNQRS